MSSDVHIAEAVLGRDAVEFLASDVGRYLIGRCDMEEREAMQSLATVSVWRRNRIRQLQNEVWRAQSVKAWLVEIITAGRQAEAILEERDSE
jgi:hypothetical protein